MKLRWLTPVDSFSSLLRSARNAIALRGFAHRFLMQAKKPRRSGIPIAISAYGETSPAIAGGHPHPHRRGIPRRRVKDIKAGSAIWFLYQSTTKNLYCRLISETIRCKGRNNCAWILLFLSISELIFPLFSL